LGSLIAQLPRSAQACHVQTAADGNKKNKEKKTFHDCDLERRKPLSDGMLTSTSSTSSTPSLAIVGLMWIAIGLRRQSQLTGEMGSKNFIGRAMSII